jgi:hypothetical protein
MATVPRKARRLSAEFRRSSDAVPHHASDAAASTGMKLERAATPPTPANVTWLRDHFQKAHVRLRVGILLASAERNRARCIRN